MKHPFRTAALAGAVIATLGLSSAAFAGGRPDLVLAGLKAGKAHEAGQLLVKYRDGATASQQSAVRHGLGAQKIDTVRAGKGELALLKLPAGANISAA
uniref:S8 family serine peptidase n=1 Tax=Devosia sp. TaxID=1871048 RepID=UPI002FCBE1F2